MSDPESGSGRAWWIAALVLASAWCLYLYLFGPKTLENPALEAPELEGTALGLPADYSWSLQDLDGRPVSFAKYRGKAVFLNVWATWCPPCREELPSIANLARSPRLADVAFVCASVDDEAGTVRRFLEGKGWPITFLHAGPANLPSAFITGGGGLPSTFLIAPDGRIAASAVGSADWDVPAVVEFLERLAGPRPAAKAKAKTP
jgi:thiol-disulfide isomerase/thioredoxin